MRKRLTNRALNKVFKSTKESVKMPKYKLNKNSNINIQLPNDMKLRIYSNKEGNYCAIEVRHTGENIENNRIETEKFERDLINFKTDSIHTDYLDNNGLKLSFNFSKWNKI
tara:strand:- start:988 stop:1320 length:333 start_codon:yes stop_codon:yes gene_type:complete